MLAVVSFFCHRSGRQVAQQSVQWTLGTAAPRRARFTSISRSVASGYSCSQTLSTPAHTQLTQTVGRLSSCSNLMRMKLDKFRVQF
jgi:hypothetical protein